MNHCRWWWMNDEWIIVGGDEVYEQDESTSASSTFSWTSLGRLWKCTVSVGLLENYLKIYLFCQMSSVEEAQFLKWTLYKFSYLQQENYFSE